MAFHCRVFLALLLINAVYAQAVAAKAATNGSWQPWIVGLTAVTVFIFIIFVLLIMNRVFCTKNDKHHQPDMELSPDDRNKNQEDSDSNRSACDGTPAANAYSNLVIIEDEKRTSL
ncbi:small integral membrane protein 24 isoform X1 [Stegostoma tigrinum]|uniref:small integral membrane protein 24 isoform X1 n=1 Tax=Stegostoma tigrinum TaxID=3053191 RepID=UPI00202ADA43|nr:small integral membrane protein 24 isoform X1 [Stegostoma tigrinum]